jgi:putative hydrolase of the HAD superfamily
MRSTPDVPTPVRVIWSDFGGVLTPSLADTFSEFSGRTGISGSHFLSAMEQLADELGMPVMAPLDTGYLTEAEWGRRIGIALEGLSGQKYDLTRFSELWFRDRPVNQAFVDYLFGLRGRGYVVGMLTNNVREWEPYWRAMLPADDLFDDIVNSCEVGHRKPGLEIFELAARRVHADPAECLLIDDLPENCAGAEAAGWRSVLFESTEASVERIEALLADQPLTRETAARA